MSETGRSVNELIEGEIVALAMHGYAEDAADRIVRANIDSLYSIEDALLSDELKAVQTLITKAIRAAYDRGA